MSLELILNIIAGFLGIILSIQDFKHQKVGVIPLFSFVIVCVLLGYFTREFCIIPFLIFIIIGLITYIFKRKQAFGLADYIMTFAISFIMPIDGLDIFIILCGILGILTSILFKKKKFPFLPIIFISSIIVKISYQIN